MKQLSRLAAAATLAVGAFISTQASAAVICSNCEYNGDTWLGMHNALTFDGSGFRHTSIGVGAFSDTWVFDFAPAGNGEVNANFIPSTAITGFTVNLRAVLAGSVCGPLVETSCAGVVLGGIISPGATAGTNAFLSWSNLAAGRYAIQVSGTNSNGSGAAQYSGQMSLYVPEPGSLALVGIALLGAAAGLRRNRKA